MKSEVIFPIEPYWLKQTCREAGPVLVGFLALGHPVKQANNISVLRCQSIHPQSFTVLTAMRLQCPTMQQDLGDREACVHVRRSTFSGFLFLHQELSPRSWLSTRLSVLPAGTVRDLVQHIICTASNFLSQGARHLAALGNPGMGNTY